MFKNKVACIDVDLTVVDSLSPWIDWWEDRTGMDFPWEDISPTKSINKVIFKHMPDALDFWEKDDLYDSLLPIRHSVSVLEKLSLSHEIYFVTKCTKGHYRSKVRFLNKFFPFNSGVINTENKHLIDADMFVEDHTEYVENIVHNRPGSTVYQFMTEDNKYQKVKGAIQVNCWSEIK